MPAVMPQGASVFSSGVAGGFRHALVQAGLTGRDRAPDPDYITPLAGAGHQQIRSGASS
jgi:hypothetical protein